MVFRLSPMSVVFDLRLRNVQDLTVALEGGRTSVNGDTDFDAAPSLELGHVLRDVLLRLFRFSTDARWSLSISLVPRGRQ